MYRKFIIVFLYFILNLVGSTKVYDQRQTGDLNIQVDLKDLNIIALMKGGKEDYMDYDYVYDYSDMTIKPQKHTTKKPINAQTTVTVASDKEKTTVVSTLSEELTTVLHDNNSTLATVTAESVVANETSVDSPTTLRTEVMTQQSKLNVKNVFTSSVAPKDRECRNGFVLNQNGDCALQMQDTNNALMELVKLSQKMKSRRESREKKQVYS